MSRNSPEIRSVLLLPREKKTCVWISDVTIVQCLLAFVFGSTITYCTWSPEFSKYDYDKLARIMYLYDPHACGYNLRGSRSIDTLQLNNETYGLNVRPIKYTPAIITVSTRLSSKTRTYINLSVFIHVIWMMTSIVLRIFRIATKNRVLKIVLYISLYTAVFVVLFDFSMAVVYIAHIQQSLTTGMILRLSGWSIEMKLDHYDRFGGWLPMVAAVCWLRGIVILILNIYMARRLSLIIRRIQKSEFKKKLRLRVNNPIPDAKYADKLEDNVLYFRAGELEPTVKQNRIFFYK